MSSFDTLQSLAEFRYQLRRFLHFSEQAATSAGLRPQQHQLLLQIAGAPKDTRPTIAYLAMRLDLRHNTAVELADRCVDAGLITRATHPTDHRVVILKLTEAGNKVLRTLSEDHLEELEERAPRLIAALQRVRKASKIGKTA